MFAADFMYLMMKVKMGVFTVDSCLSVHLYFQGSLGKPIYRWEDNIKMDLLEVGCGGMN
jgi:hypothetical protein